MLIFFYHGITSSSPHLSPPTPPHPRPGVAVQEGVWTNLSRHGSCQAGSTLSACPRIHYWYVLSAEHCRVWWDFCVALYHESGEQSTEYSRWKEAKREKGPRRLLELPFASSQVVWLGWIMKAGKRRPGEQWEPAWEGGKLGKPGFSCSPEGGVEATRYCISSYVASGLSFSSREAFQE